MELSALITEYWGITLFLLTLAGQALWAFFTIGKNTKDIEAIKQRMLETEKEREILATENQRIHAKIETSIAVITEKLDNIVKTLEEIKKKQ